MPSNQKSSANRRWLFSVVVALVLQSLYPSGYMPGDLEDGWIATLCPSGLPASFAAVLDSSGHGHHHHDSQEGDQSPFESCELGNGIDQPISLAQTDLALPPVAATTLLGWHARTHAASTHTHHRQPRGPPIS